MMTKPKKAAEKNQAAPSLNDVQHLDIVMINALLNSLFTIFSTMVRLDIQAGIPVIKRDNISQGAASGLIAMKNREGQALRLTPLKTYSLTFPRHP